jgi:hypothetical protein
MGEKAYVGMPQKFDEFIQFCLFTRSADLFVEYVVAFLTESCNSK